MKLSLFWVVAIATVGGAAVFCVLLPWGDPCTVMGYSRQPCPIVLSASRTQLANLVFVAICLVVGFIAGSVSRRYIAGTLSAPLAALLGGISGHYFYSMKAPWFDSKVPGAYLMAALFIGGIALLGTIGAVAARWATGSRRANA